LPGLLPNKDWKIVRASSENTGNQKFARHAANGVVRKYRGRA